MSTWIWEQTDWPAFRWRETKVSPVLARARLAQGRILGAAGLLDPSLTQHAVLDEDAHVESLLVLQEEAADDVNRCGITRFSNIDYVRLPSSRVRTSYCGATSSGSG